MKKLFCVSLIVGITASCSHQAYKSESERVPASPVGCVDMLQPFLHNKPNISYSEKTWKDLDTSIRQEFDRQLIGKNGVSYYSKDIPHIRILEKIFKIKHGRKIDQNVSEIVSSYNKYMDNLINKKVVNKEDVLRPAFAVKLNNGQFSWKQFGDELPDGAAVSGDVLPLELYNDMLRAGFFPLGTETITNTKISSFEHDLAHLTGFMETPEFMKALKKLSQEEESVPYTNGASRAYYFNEGLATITSANDKVLMKLLKLSDEMKLNPSDVSYEEMLAYLKGFSNEELEKTARGFLTSNDYYTISGGAGRDPISGLMNESHNLVSSKSRKLIVSQYSEVEKNYVIAVVPEQLAAFQVMLLKMRGITIDDWAYATTHNVEKDSAIYKLFIDKKAWSDDGLQNGGSPTLVRHMFLNDIKRNMSEISEF